MEQTKDFIDFEPAFQVWKGWRNLYFIRGGRTLWGAMARDTEAQCERGSESFFSQVRDRLAGGWTDGHVMGDGTEIPYSDFVFAIPFPDQSSSSPK